MIHTKELFIKKEPLFFTESDLKKILVKRLINKMPLTEIEKFVKFDKKEVEVDGKKDTKLTATIELIDV